MIQYDKTWDDNDPAVWEGMPLRLWDDINVDGCATHEELIDGLEDRRFPEGCIDGLMWSIENLPFIETTEDLLFFDTRRRPAP